MSEYTFPVQFTFTIELTSKGETLEEVADILEKQLHKGKSEIRYIFAYMNDWRNPHRSITPEFQEIQRDKGWKMTEEEMTTPKSVIEKKKAEAEEHWPEWYHYPVAKLDLPKMTRNALERNARFDTETVGELVRHSEDDLTCVRCIGAYSRKWIIESLEAHGLHLEMTDEEIRNADTKW